MANQAINTPAGLGRAVRNARKHLGLTQPQLALAAGVGVRFIVDLEAGKPTVRLQSVMNVIDSLGGQLQLAEMPGTDETETTESNPG